ncbi:MAG: hypothetical protein HZB26_18610 [Candidatus Hydrogenedentes bacterium]|nr:hypothetical protein [Candidatus Hydrogenedentota bacterium]
MKSTANRTAAVLVAIVALFATTGFADVTVSITLSGNLDDMLPVIQHLKDMGIGAGKGPAAAGEAIKMEVHSVAPALPVPGVPTPPPPAPGVPGAPAVVPPAAPAPPPKPALTLGAPLVNPASPKAGVKAVITAPVIDPDHKIDSVAVLIPELNKMSVDLFDNGTHGDTTPHDGTWTAEVTLPADVAAGDYTMRAVAFNANGEAILAPGKDGTVGQLSAQTKISVTK